ncbi:hypothetical protein MMC09_004281 [Bachmanniomyces sp. S44760]|nr:hypothetical protein [Bachmanniomyces sp. S44760]
MPTISTPSKIAATKSYGAEVIFSGSTSEEREEVVRKVQARTGAILVPPYDHPDIILGQGTLALEMEEQVRDLVREDPALSVHYEEAQTSGLTDCSVNGNANVKGNGEIKRIQEGQGQAVQPNGHNHDDHSSTKQQSQQSEPPPFHLNALLAPTGGGGLLSGLSIAHHPTPTLLFGAEPSFQNAHDLVRALSRTPPQHIPSVSTLTIADGLRTPIGLHPWNLVSDKEYVEGAYAVSEMEIKKAMRLVVERMKVLVEPSAVVGLAVALFHEGFRRRVEREGNGRGEGKCKKGGWDVGIVLSGGNTTIEALGDLFSAEEN